MNEWMRRLPKWIWACFVFATLAVLEAWLGFVFPELWAVVKAAWIAVQDWMGKPSSLPRFWWIVVATIALGLVVALGYVLWSRRRGKPVLLRDLSLHELYVLSALAVLDGRPVSAIEVARHRGVSQLRIENAIDSLVDKELLLSPLVVTGGEMKYSLTSAGRELVISSRIEGAIAARTWSGK